MKRIAVLALLVFAPALLAAPVPKEVRHSPSYVGTWLCVTLDPKDPAKRHSTGQHWIIDPECGVAFHGVQQVGSKPKPSERFAFDPKTGHVNHTLIGGTQRMLHGVYRIEGDLLTIHLNTGDPSVRPAGFDPNGGYSMWHLQHVENAK